MECDTLLMIGSGFPYSEFLPKEGQARGVQIDIDPSMLSMRYPDGGQPARRRRRDPAALLPLLEQKTDTRLARAHREGTSREWWKMLEDRALASANPINPQRVDLGAVAAPAGRRDRHLATPAPAPTGTPATSRSAAA